MKRETDYRNHVLMIVTICVESCDKICIIFAATLGFNLKYVVTGVGDNVAVVVKIVLPNSSKCCRALPLSIRNFATQQFDFLLTIIIMI